MYYIKNLIGIIIFIPSFILWCVYILYLEILKLIFIKIPYPKILDENKMKTDELISVCQIAYNKGLISMEEYWYEHNHIFPAISLITYTGYYIRMLPCIMFVRYFDFTNPLVGYFTKLWLKSARESKDFSNMYVVKSISSLGLSIFKLRNYTAYAYQKGYLFLIPAFLFIGLNVSFVFGLNIFPAFISLLILTLVWENILIGNEVVSIQVRSFYDLYARLFGIFILLTSIHFYFYTHSIQTIITYAFAVGIFGYPICHELGHRNNKIDKLISYLISVNLLYPFFNVTHNKVHHRFVATKEDSITAEYNMNFYKYFLLQIKNFYSRGLLLGKKTMIIGMLTQIVMLAVSFIFSKTLFIYFIVQFIVGFFLIEIINYVEHYGIVREKKNSLLNTSWDSTNILTNGSLFNLGYHSHHHYKDSVEFYNLKPKSKFQTDFGYFTLLLMALTPGIWKQEMNEGTK